MSSNVEFAVFFEFVTQSLFHVPCMHEVFTTRYHGYTRLETKLYIKCIFRIIKSISKTVKVDGYVTWYFQRNALYIILF